MADAVRPSAAVLVILATDPIPALLLIRRSQRPGDPWSGHWALPGGRCQAEDGTLQATALREAREEVGLAIDDHHPLMALPHASAGQHRGMAILVAPFLCRFHGRPCLIPDPREVAGIQWLALSELARDEGRCCGRVPGGGERDWFFRMVDGYPLWGFTLRVLEDWHRSHQAGADPAWHDWSVTSP